MKVRGGSGESTLCNGCLAQKKNGIRDLTILQNSIQTSITGFKDVVKAYKDGTEEIKSLLTNECDIIYECKACRNMFRSFFNFISHKRTYCKNNFNTTQHFHFRENDPDITTVIEPSDVQSNGKENPRDLCSIIDRLNRREMTSQLITLDDLYDQARQNLTEEDIIKRKQKSQLEKVTSSDLYDQTSQNVSEDGVVKKKQKIQLETIANTNVALYQTLQNEDGDSIRKEMDEIHVLENVNRNRTVVLGPDGKPSGVSGSTDKCMASKTRLKNLCCKICHRKFITEKMLRIHIKAKHIQSTHVYPCNSCSLTFLSAKGLIRHLRNDHQKPMRRIRLMRDGILRRLTRKDEVQSKRPKRELTQLQNGASTQSMSNNNATICFYCSKKMRRAALHTHLKNCPHRDKQSISNDLANNVDVGNVDKSEHSFMEMLKKEKESQAEMQKCIDEEESSLLGSDLSRANSDVAKSDLELVPVVKNKRKRHLVQKVDQSTEYDDNIGNTIWQMNEDVPKTEPVNCDNVEEATSVILTDTKKTKRTKTKKATVEKNTDCTICTKKFANISNLKRHVTMRHYRQKTFGCKLCDYTAFRRIDITHHLGVSHHIGGESGDCSEFVVNVQIDSNKFNDEKIRAVALSLNKIKQELLGQSNDIDRMDSVDIPLAVAVPDTTIQSNDSISASNSSNSPEKLATDTKENISNLEKRETHGRRFNKSANSTESRTLSQNSSSDSLPESQPSQMNRPVRNRVKIMNKDFVYDLSNLLRKEAVVYREQLIPLVIKTQKRKLSQTTDVPVKEKEDIAEVLPKNLPVIRPIVGSANSMAQKAIESFLACSNKAPELPSERPIVPAKIMRQARNWRPVHTDGMARDYVNHNRPSSSDKLYEVLAIKSHLHEVGSMVANGVDLMQNTPGYSILTPITDPSLSLDESDPAIYSTSTFGLVCQQQRLNYKKPNLDSNNAFTVSKQMESQPTNGKRITLIQRLIDNKSKKMETE